LIGQSRNDINSSEYLHKILGEEYSPCPHFELEEEFSLQQTLITLIKDKLISSAHDVSEGGLAITLMESAFPNELGFEVAANDAAIRKDAYWFGESQSRVVVTVPAENEKAFAGSLQSAAVPFALLGTVTARAIRVDGQDWGSITDWKNKYDNAIGDILKKHESEEALSVI
jgi:phosphoribosylformylglycinamidine synthase